MGPVSDPSAAIDERYRSEKAALEQLIPTPRRPLAHMRYWFGRLGIEMIYKLLPNASVWFAGRQEHNR
jgi:hypothetical protein